MPVAEAPDDDDVRETYNFAPTYNGLVYRADVPDYGSYNRPHDSNDQLPRNEENRTDLPSTQLEDPKETRYKLQAMKWGLIPSWTKRNPDTRTMTRTINARAEALANTGGMWNVMKQRKRCIVVAQGFYEWLKKDGSKEKIPHFVKRQDEKLMCFAGLWDCVQYDGSDEKTYTYTIITTDANKQISFLHDRMPVILENGSDQLRTWLDPNRCEWSKELQSLLKPFEGILDCYPVSKDVGKVGNDSPTFIVPVASTENKNNIANFFSKAKKSAEGGEAKEAVKAVEEDVKEEGSAVKHVEGEARTTVDHSSTEDNAPLPAPVTEPPKLDLKRKHESDYDEDTTAETLKGEQRSGDQDKRASKSLKTKSHTTARHSPEKTPKSKRRSATDNGTVKASPTSADGSQKITNFYK